MSVCGVSDGLMLSFLLILNWVIEFSQKILTFIQLLVVYT